MKMIPKIISCILLLSILSGCSGSSPAATTVPTESPTVTTAVIETTVATETPVVTTEPTVDPNLLDVESGTHFSKYVDPNSNDFLELYTFMPENAVKDMPLIVFLHGDGEIGKSYLLEHIALVDNAIEIYGEDYPFIAIAPCKRQKSWCEHQVPGTVLSLIDDTVEKYQINPDKVIITGFSSGAMGAWYMITNHTERFSCCVPISCPNEYPILYHKIKEIPIWGFVGEKEEYYTEKMAEIINWTAEIGGDAKLTVLEGMYHKGMDKATYTEEVIEWMLSQ